VGGMMDDKKFSKELDMPTCPNCGKLQIKLLRFYYENCEICNTKLISVKYKRVE